MSLLSQIRQDSSAFVAAAEAEIASISDISAPFAVQSPLLDASTLATIVAAPDEWTLPASEYLPAWLHGMPVVAFAGGVDGSLANPSADANTATLGASGAALDYAGNAIAFHHAAPPAGVVAPASPCVPCPGCGSPFWWAALGDSRGERLRCCECSPPPTRRMLTAVWCAWFDGRLDGPGDGIDGGLPPQRRWVWWRPRRWNPFAHLDAAEEKCRAASEAAAVVAEQSRGGF